MRWHDKFINVNAMDLENGHRNRIISVINCVEIYISLPSFSRYPLSFEYPSPSVFIWSVHCHIL